MTVTAPTKVKKGAAPTVKATFKAIGTTVTGKVSFRFNGKTVTRTLSNQKASLKLPKLKKTTKVTVTYLGNGLLNAVTRVKTIKV